MGTKETLPAEIAIKQTQTSLDNVLKVKITTPKEMEKATELLSQIKKQSDAITKEKEKVTKPLNTALTNERKRWKPAEDMLKKAKDHLRSEMSRYQTEADEKAEADRDKVIGRMGSGKGKFSAETAGKKLAEIDGPETNVETDSGSVSFRKDFEVTVIDKHQIPQEYLEVDISGIKKALKDGVEVPGITFKVIKIPINKSK